MATEDICVCGHHHADHCEIDRNKKDSQGEILIGCSLCKCKDFDPMDEPSPHEHTVSYHPPWETGMREKSDGLD